VIGLLLAGYALVLGCHLGAAAGGSDSSGYLNSARLLAAGRATTAQRALATLPPDALSRRISSYLYIPLGFRPAATGSDMAPTYPVGLPVFILLFHWLAGWSQAANAVALLHALGGVAAVYALARTLRLGVRGALLAAAAVGLSPLYLTMAVQAMTDVPSLAWTALAVTAALRAGRHPGWGALAGGALAVDVLLRPANLLALVPVAVALGPELRRWFPVVLAGLPGATFLLLYNDAAYGRAFTTGYGDSLFAFRWSYVPGTLLHYLHWLPLLFTPLVLAFLALPWARREPSRNRAVLLCWFGAYAAFYCAYANTHETWWYLRFLLPAAPALVVGALLAGRSLWPADRPPGPRPALAAGLLIAAWAAGGAHKLHPLRVADQELRYGRINAWLRAHLPPSAVCLVKQDSGALLYFTDFALLRWDEIRPGDAPLIEQSLAASRRPLYAVLFRFELAQDPPPQDRLPGIWLPVGTVEDAVVSRQVAIHL